MDKKILLCFTFLASILWSSITFSAVPVINFAAKHTVPSGGPERIAADSEGKIYITDNLKGVISVFSNNGLHISDLSITGSPLGIAVDQSGRLYISDRKMRNTGVYNSAGDLLFKLGTGDNEFLLPNDIAVSTTGKVFVSDSKANMVKIYSTTNGALMNTFGSGLLKFPSGITVDDLTSEVFVLDYGNLYIRVYDLNGNHKRSIRSNGGGMMGAIRILAPLDIAVDSTRIYISDAFNSVVAVYDRGSGSFLKYIGNYGTGNIEFKTPSGLVIDKDMKMFVSNSGNQRVEVLGIDSYSNIVVSPSILDFYVYAMGSSVTQTVNLSSDLNNTTWTATSSEPWVSLSADSGPTPSSVYVTVDPSGILPGNYSVDVEFRTSSGMVSLLRLNVEVNMPILAVAPSSLNLIYQKNSVVFPSGVLLVNSIGAALPWSGSSNAEWLALDSAKKVTPSSAVLNVSNSISAFDLGTYTASVMIDAGAYVIGSPAAVDVTLTIIEAGDIKVTTNLDASTFTITGPQSLSGGGKSWTGANAQPGTYFISFDHVSGYVRPYSRSFTVESGRTTEINAKYVEKKVFTHIIAGSGRKKEAELTVLTMSGEKVFSVLPFEDAKSVRVAAGDLDGSGSDKIVVTDYERSIKVYSFEGIELASLALSKSYKYADIAVGDIDNDGKAEIIVGVLRDKPNDQEQKRVIKSFSYSDGQIIEKAILFTEKTEGDFSIALGDINGDGMPEAIIADSKNVRAFSINNNAGNELIQIWTVRSSWKNLPRIAAGDLNDDGIDEIGLSVMKSKNIKNPVIRILNGSGEDFGIAIDAFGDLGYKKTSSVCFGDIDGDGIDEIAAGSGEDTDYLSYIRFFESDGTFTNKTIEAIDGVYGVNVGLGHFEK